jgi:dUTP pyrophosphatase
MNGLRVLIQKEADAADLPLPAYATPGSAGMDLYAAVTDDLTIEPGRRAVISTGLRLAIPDGYEAQVRPRSGWAARHGIGMVNSPGTIDSDYRGVVSVILVNWGDEPVVVRRRDRIAQLVVAPVARVDWQEVAGDALPQTSRHEGGFGHTGLA